VRVGAPRSVLDLGIGRVVAPVGDVVAHRAVEQDIHASILYLLGLDHLKTTFFRNGRAERPTVTGGNLITKLWA
jgi:hypothetical protein